MTGEVGGDDVVVPSTLRALLGARLDQLDEDERSVLERGAIEGEIFHRGAVQALAPDETQVTPRLAALVRKALIRSDKPQLRGEDAFRFRHLLIRDAAYDALPKATRADLHERFASWIEEHGTEIVELDEILGYHLEQACVLSRRARDDRRRHHCSRGAAAPDGRRPPRGPPPGLRAPPSGLLERAAALVPAAELDLALEIELGEALSLDRQGRRRGAARRSPRRESRRGRRSRRRALRERPGGHVPHLRRARGRGGEACDARRARVACVSGRRRRHGAVRRLLRACRGGVHARADGSPRGGVRAGLRPRSARRATHRLCPLRSRAGGRFFGATPVSELLAWLDENEPTRRAGPPPPCLPGCGAGDARPLRRGARDPRRSACGAGRTRPGSPARRRHRVPSRPGSSSGPTNPLPHASSESAGFRLLEELEELSSLSTAAGYLAQVLYALERLDEADAWAGRARGARRERRRDDADALATGQGEGARAPRRAR